MSEWKNSIVTYIDLVGIKGIADRGQSMATDIMRSVHRLVEMEMNTNMPNHDHCYIWNDSVLLLSVLDGTYSTRKIDDVMRDANGLKRKIDQINPSYAIAVKGQVFPDETTFYAPTHDGCSSQSRTLRLKTSSYAMGNCFFIESELGKKLKKPWYVDSRIAKQLSSTQTHTKHNVKMLPNNSERSVWVYNDHLW
ncbi:hypothetical protein [Hydrogenovibrio kuenenii]|uniref:hypothetical protein n=1 Tax=Hydrogenovibrio kuenenii TaxID=63658 RepID=UPI00056F637D|nr:hypothetical protein [Hydrogenovibrio kuenenii]